MVDARTYLKGFRYVDGQRGPPITKKTLDPFGNSFMIFLFRELCISRPWETVSNAPATSMLSKVDTLSLP